MSTSEPRILIVEDEIIVALFMEDIPMEFGYEIASVVGRLDDAMARSTDFAVPDLHLNGQSVFDFAGTLAARGCFLWLCHGLWRTRCSRLSSQPASAAKTVSTRRPKAGAGTGHTSRQPKRSSNRRSLGAGAGNLDFLMP
jgi:hypothetical protein